MVTAEERESIINEAMERMLKIIPETIGNMMVANASYQKLTQEFYDTHPEFSAHRDIVREVVGKVEGNNPTKPYEDILKEAIPDIKNQIQLKGGLSLTTPTKEALESNGLI